MRSKAAVVLLVVLALLGGAGLLESEAQQPVVPPGPPLVITPPVPGPTPAPDPDSVEPDDLKPVFTVKATIAGEVQAGEIVTLPVGRLLVLTVEGLPSEGKPAVTWAMNAKCVDVSIRENGWYVTFTAPVEGNWLFTAAVNNPEPAGPPLVAQRWVVVSGHGPRPPPEPTDPDVPDEPTPEPAPSPQAVTAVVYVYEKDQGGVPSGVMKGLDRLNRERKIVATAVDDDVTDGDGETPDQYKIPFQAARDSGKLPALVVMTGATAKQVWHNVTTEKDVMEAAK